MRIFRIFATATWMATYAFHLFLDWLHAVPALGQIFKVTELLADNNVHIVALYLVTAIIAYDTVTAHSNLCAVCSTLHLCNATCGWALVNADLHLALSAVHPVLTHTTSVVVALGAATCAMAAEWIDAALRT